MSALGLRLRKARKEHTCFYCDTVISPGVRYWRWAWAEEGTVSSGKAHQSCQHLGWSFRLFDADWLEQPMREWILEVDASSARHKTAHIERLQRLLAPDLATLARLGDDLVADFVQVIEGVTGESEHWLIVGLVGKT